MNAPDQPDAALDQFWDSQRRAALAQANDGKATWGEQVELPPPTKFDIHEQENYGFEKEAAKELADGKPEFEAIEGGYYRRAGTIPLHEGCLSCHEGLFKPNSKLPRFSGLVISIPVRED